MIYIERIVRKMKQGQTGPYLCVADDGHQYIVKGPNTTYKGLIHEWVCAELGKEIGLPIPDFEIAYVDRSLLEYGNYELSEGDWFASRYVENIQDVPYKMLNQFDHDDLKLLFIFDYWIKNCDRNLTEKGGNPNLFICSDLYSFIVLDHNLAFDEDYDKTFDALKKCHVGSHAWFSEQRELLDRDGYEKLLAKCFDKLELIFKGIPNEWLANCLDSSIVEDIRVVLSRFKTPEFWEGIK